MNKEKEEMLNYLNEISELAILNLREHDGYESYEVVDVKYCGEIECTNKEAGEQVKLPRVDIIASDINNKKETIKLTYVGTEQLDDEFLREYDIGESIKDKVGEETKEQDEKVNSQSDDLKEEKEEEKEEEKKGKKEESEDKDDKKKRKPHRILETVNPDKAKMDYWHTVKQAFGLPPKVATLAFAYPVSSEDKVDYANITIYMLDKDGYIINDLKVDDYFKFDSSTGNNPTNDKTKRLEKDENRGNAQLDENNTMVRLEAVHPKAQYNTYISIEQINKMGDYRDINVGRQTLHTTDYVEKQVVTDRVRRDFDSEAEELMKSNGGQYKLKDIYKEAEKHKEHEDTGYIDVSDADGIEETFECVGERDWKELATKWGYYKDGKPDEEKAKKVYEEYKYNNPHLSDDEVVQEVSDDLYDQIPGRNSRQ